MIKRAFVSLAVSVLLPGVTQGGPRYHVTHLPSLGGGTSLASSINNRGWIAGRSNLPGNQTRHAVLWRNGVLTDLGTLGGPNSNVVWPVKATNGLVVGISQTAEPDPRNEDWSCATFFPAATRKGFRCVGFAWRNGVMRELPTLGGTHGFATGANNAGRIVGWAENTVEDPECVPPQVLQFRAVVWEPDGSVRELPPLAGDSVSAATAINASGKIVGISGICDDAVGKFSARSAVMWENGVPRDLGNIGGRAWNTAMAINAAGDVAGFANVTDTPDGAFNAHAFLWTARRGIRDLRTLGDDVFSQAYGINVKRQVVGRSCDASFNCRAVLWQDGEILELQKLVQPGYTGTLTIAADIDDQGRITGQAFDPAQNAFVGFVANPIVRNARSEFGRSSFGAIATRSRGRR